VAHAIGREIDPVTGGILGEVPKDVGELEGLSQKVGIGAEPVEVSAEDGDADASHGSGGTVAIAKEGGCVGDPHPGEVILHSPDDVRIKGGGDPAFFCDLDGPKKEGSLLPAGRSRKVMGKAPGPGVQMGSDVDIGAGLVGQIVHHPAKDVEIIEIGSVIGGKKREGTIEGAAADSGPGSLEAFGVKGERRGRGEGGIRQEKAPVGRFVVLAEEEIIMDK
jgi:hypothetical protein